MGRALSIVVCVGMCEMFETNSKFKDRPKTRKQKIVRDKIHLLQKVGKKLYTGDKINLLETVRKSKIKQLSVYRNNSKDQVGD